MSKFLVITLNRYETGHSVHKFVETEDALGALLVDVTDEEEAEWLKSELKEGRGFHYISSEEFDTLIYKV